MNTTYRLLLLLVLLTHNVSAAEFFVAPAGSDANAGTIDKPFASLAKAQDAVSPGDTVWIRGGTYAIKEEQIAKSQRIFAYVIHLTKSGTATKPIRYWAYKDEKPVFDFATVKPARYRVHAFQVHGSWLHLRGLDVTGVQVTIKTHTQSICFANDSSHNIYERLTMHDGQAIGYYGVNGSDNLVLNCDAYNNHDYVSEDGRGGNTDGFGCHPTHGSTGNVFRGCRAWYNSDDGYDCITAAESVLFDNCWAFNNGTNAKKDRLGDGNGFKIGGFAATPASRLPNPVPRHTVQNCVSVSNRANGFYANHHPTGSDWIHNTAYRNGTNFNMLCRIQETLTDIDGINHTLKYNLSFGSKNDLVRLNQSRSTLTANWFQMDRRVAATDFISVDEKELTLPRQANGDLPVIKFLHLAKGSPLNDAGTHPAYPFRETKTYLGAFAP